MKKVLYLLVAVALLASCKNNGPKVENAEKKIGVLLVNHGSHSEIWREMLMDLEDALRDDLFKNEKISELKTAHMEYTEPSIASQLKWYDQNNYDEVIVVPIFLTVSSHYSHDIPVICGVSSDPKIEETLAGEKIEIYHPKARVRITPPLDYATILKKNVARRVADLSKEGKNEAVLLVAYGDAEYNQQWEEMVSEIGKYLKIKSGHESIAYAWCGHLVGYSPQPTIDGISKLFELEDEVIVVPLLVANDPYFQNDIIQVAVDQVENSSHVLYKQDAILPDENIEKWVVEIANQTIENL